MGSLAGENLGAVVALTGNCIHSCFSPGWSALGRFWQDGDTYNVESQDGSKSQGC
jgi:hypothetical protein